MKVKVSFHNAWKHWKSDTCQGHPIAKFIGVLDIDIWIDYRYLEISGTILNFDYTFSFQRKPKRFKR